MVPSLTDALISTGSSIKPGKRLCAEEISRLHQCEDAEGMRSFADAYIDYWIRKNNMPEFTEGLRQGALRNLDEASYIADLICKSRSSSNVLEEAARQLAGVPQHLWQADEARKFYHNSINYQPPFGADCFHTVLDNAVYLMPLGSGEENAASVWLLMNRFVMSEDTAIDYLKNKILELENFVKKIAARRISEEPDAPKQARLKTKIDGITDLERAILLLPDEIRRKIVAGYEDCIKGIRKEIAVPKEPADYISLRLGILPKESIDSFKPKVKNCRWYDTTLRFLGLQGAPTWEEVIPYDQISSHEPDIKIEVMPLKHRFDVYLAVKSAFSFFSEKDNFARLTEDQNLIPQQLLADSVRYLHQQDYKKQEPLKLN